MEDLELTPPDLSALRGKRVFVTGHTGFKGSWLTLLLERLGCTVAGYALAPSSIPSLFDLTGIRSSLSAHTIADIRDEASLNAAVNDFAPDLVLHLAAQPIVRRSYAAPAETWQTNVIGTVNVLEAARACGSVRAVVVVTTDKVYENAGWVWGYRETDRLGGYDPYSASKAATELVVDSYRRSFFGDTGVLLASARAGNVIGGGDWSQDRILADAARAAAAGETLTVRNPAATRPWQHVLDCLAGYLTLARALLNGNRAAATAFNFGPDASDNVSVASLLDLLRGAWPELEWAVEAPGQGHPHEAAYLYLDPSRAHRDLGWAPQWSLAQAADRTANWYREVARDSGTARALTVKQIDEYLSAAAPSVIQSR